VHRASSEIQREINEIDRRGAEEARAIAEEARAIAEAARRETLALTQRFDQQELVVREMRDTFQAMRRSAALR
jgi:vacuolar-type H+-ATPase subunit E/Vma4